MDKESILKLILFIFPFLRVAVTDRRVSLPDTEWLSPVS